MHPFQEKRVKARKILLGNVDVVAFRCVPDFIVDAFFGDCTYLKRLIVCSFSYLNGISKYQLLQLIRWKDFSQNDQHKIEKLLLDLERPEYQAKYYSFNVHHGLVMYLNGNIRKFGQRV